MSQVLAHGGFSGSMRVSQLLLTVICTLGMSPVAAVALVLEWVPLCRRRAVLLSEEDGVRSEELLPSFLKLKAFSKRLPVPG